MDKVDIISKETLSFLDEQSDAMLALIWCELNAWVWPEMLPGLPDGEEYSISSRKYGGAVMGEISRRVSEKYISRCWNIVAGGITGDGFNIWYDSRPLSDDEMESIFEEYDCWPSFVQLERPWTQHVELMPI